MNRRLKRPFNIRIVPSFAESDAKRIKSDSRSELPSKVVHVRNIPSNMSENDVALFAIPFGKIAFLMMMKRSNQALIEMETIDEAIQMVDYYTEFPFVINDRHIGIQYSLHNQLETSFDSKPANAAVTNANKIVDVDLPKVSSSRPLTVLRLLLDVVSDSVINHFVIYKVFHRFGIINRILIFKKNDSFNCLIEFKTHTQAFVALLHLNGQNIYQDACNMQIEFSNKEGSLEIRSENDKCRDYTKNPLTHEEKRELDSLGIHNSRRELSPPPMMRSHAPPHRIEDSFDSPYGPPKGNLFNSIVGHLSGLTRQPRGINLIPEPAANYMPMPPRGHHYHRLSPLPYDPYPRRPERTRYEEPERDDYYSHKSREESPILLVTGLDETRITPDALFTLFGVYGDVLKVKIIYNKLNTALIEFINSSQARTAMNNLSGSILWGKVLKVCFSKHTTLNLSKAKESDDKCLNKDYFDSNLHRFRKPHSKNFSNIFPPSKTLHLSNIPEISTTDDIIKIFNDYNFNICHFQFMPREKKMALVTLETQDEASQALIALHNYPLSSESHLRVSFSKPKTNNSNH